MQVILSTVLCFGRCSLIVLYCCKLFIHASLREMSFSCQFYLHVFRFAAQLTSPQAYKSQKQNPKRPYQMTERVPIVMHTAACLLKAGTVKPAECHCKHGCCYAMAQQPPHDGHDRQAHNKRKANANSVFCAVLAKAI